MRSAAPPKNILPVEELANFARKGQLHAVLDACDAPALLDQIRELPEDTVVCLYIRQAEEDFSAFAPYLVSVDADLLKWTFDVVAQEGGGIFVITDADQETLQRHLRRFLLALDPNGGEMYFRFYDPRVLPKFLSACTEAECRDLFGPVRAFGVVQEGAVQLLLEQEGPLPTFVAPRPARHGLFQVRNEHLRAFQKEAERAFEFRLAAHLRKFHSGQVEALPAENLLVLLRHGIARARRYGLYSEADLTAFVAIMFEIAPNFDKHPYIQDLLTDRRTLPNQKVDALVKRVPKYVWEDAVRRNDPMAWLDTAKEID